MDASHSLSLRKNLLYDAFGDYAIISLRGPRRAGKTTLIKFLIREALLHSLSRPNKVNPLKVAYVRCDKPGLGGVSGLASIIQDFIGRRANYPGDVHIFSR